MDNKWIYLSVLVILVVLAWSSGYSMASHKVNDMIQRHFESTSNSKDVTSGTSTREATGKSAETTVYGNHDSRGRNYFTADPIPGMDFITKTTDDGEITFYWEPHPDSDVPPTDSISVKYVNEGWSSTDNSSSEPAKPSEDVPGND